MSDKTPEKYYAIVSKLSRSENEEIERLYQIEDKIHQLIAQASEILMAHYELRKSQRYPVAISTELYVLLDGYDRRSAKAAVKAWISLNGDIWTDETK